MSVSDDLYIFDRGFKALKNLAVAVLLPFDDIVHIERHSVVTEDRMRTQVPVQRYRG